MVHWGRLSDKDGGRTEIGKKLCFIGQTMEVGIRSMLMHVRVKIGPIVIL